MEVELSSTRKAAAWCFTLFGEEAAFKSVFMAVTHYVKEEVMTYAIIGRETCPETGKKHLQGYTVFKSARTFKILKEMMPRAHLEVAKGSSEDNILYCSKEGNFQEFGERPKGKGKRSDIDTIKEWVSEGGEDLKELFHMSTSYQAYKYGQTGIMLHSPKRDFKTHVIWIWGPTGSGKSERVWRMFPEAWGLGEVRNGFMFSNYSGEDVVILDDLRPQDCTMAQLIKLFDAYPMSVRTIGGVINWAPHIVVVTCPIPPEKFYKDQPEERLAQLLRRIYFIAESTQYKGDEIWHDAFPQEPCPDVENLEISEISRKEVGGNTSPRPSV